MDYVRVSENGNLFVGEAGVRVSNNKRPNEYKTLSATKVFLCFAIVVLQAGCLVKFGNLFSCSVFNANLGELIESDDIF